MKQPAVTAVVLAHNNLADTLECLESLRGTTYRNLGVILVDNGSTDDTAARVRTEFPNVRIVPTGVNLGVAGGFNAGIVPAMRGGADYVLILNNDISVPPDMVERLVRAAEEDPRCGILMPKILYYDDRSRIWSAGARYRMFPPAIVMRGLNKSDGPLYNTPTYLEYAPTCGLLIRSSVFERIGLFDDGYFFYFDDWDFSVRTQRAGFRICYVPDARLFHKVSRTIQNKGRPPFFWRTWGASCARFYRRFGKLPWLSVLVHVGYLAIREAMRGGVKSIPYFIQGAYRGYRGQSALPPRFSGE